MVLLIFHHRRPYVIRPASTFASNHYSSFSPCLIILIFFTRQTKYQYIELPCNKAGISKFDLLSSSRTSVRVKLGLFNAKIRNENRRYIHRLIYQLNEKDLLCHSI